LRDKKTPNNSRFAKAGGACFYESEVLYSSFVDLMKFIAEKPDHRKSAKRWLTYLKMTLSHHDPELK